ncbi:MAG: hypothetical protein DHS20C18_51180 [Saprospiraceae bacterium]|nr:MAG: hypothetical protein DHS20C18_51180 [Saprospiraceae bacterium]
MRKHTITLLLASLIFTSCTKKLYPDRSQFIPDGGVVPTVQLDKYRSVQKRKGQQSDLAVGLAISGGGSRAANFAIGVMLGLEDIPLEKEQDVLDQVDYLSTVSGGGFAGGAYITALFEHEYFKDTSVFSLRAYLDKQIQKDLRESYVKSLIKGNLTPWYWFTKINDGDALEKAVDDHVLGYKRRKKEDGTARSILLGDIFISKDSLHQPVRFPMHFANSSILSTMAIFPFAPDVLERYGVNGYTHRLKRIRRDSIDPYQIPLSIGIKASGSFPVLISNSILCSQLNHDRCYLHLIDGAMSDNIGYYTALQVLKQDTAPRKVIFIIDADTEGNRYTFSNREAAKSAIAVYSRLASSGLDARRIILERDLTEMGKRFGIYPVFFSYNALIRNNPAIPPAKIFVKKEQTRLIKLMKKNLDELTNVDLQILYELVTNIGTKYSITDEEQDLLLLTGQKIVRLQKKEILNALRIGGQ